MKFESYLATLSDVDREALLLQTARANIIASLCGKSLFRNRAKDEQAKLQLQEMHDKGQPKPCIMTTYIGRKLTQFVSPSSQKYDPTFKQKLPNWKFTDRTHKRKSPLKGQPAPPRLTKKEAVAVAEKLAKENNGLLPGTSWLNKNGYGSVSNLGRFYPETIAHIPKQVSTQKTKEDWLVIIKELIAQHGELPTKKWCSENGYVALYWALFRDPIFFKEYLPKKMMERPTTVKESVLLANRLAEEHEHKGLLPISGWLKANGYNAILKHMSSHPKAFKKWNTLNRCNQPCKACDPYKRAITLQKYAERPKNQEEKKARKAEAKLAKFLNLKSKKEIVAMLQPIENDANPGHGSDVKVQSSLPGTAKRKSKRNANIMSLALDVSIQDKLKRTAKTLDVSVSKLAKDLFLHFLDKDNNPLPDLPNECNPVNEDLAIQNAITVLLKKLAKETLAKETLAASGQMSKEAKLASQLYEFVEPPVNEDLAIQNAIIVLLKKLASQTLTSNGQMSKEAKLASQLYEFVGLWCVPTVGQNVVDG